MKDLLTEPSLSRTSCAELWFGQTLCSGSVNSIMVGFQSGLINGNNKVRVSGWHSMSRNVCWTSCLLSISPFFSLFHSPSLCSNFEHFLRINCPLLKLLFHTCKQSLSLSNVIENSCGNLLGDYPWLPRLPPATIVCLCEEMFTHKTHQSSDIFLSLTHTKKGLEEEIEKHSTVYKTKFCSSNREN